jgi:crossover junction endodeoxyribonuclease RuvC
MRVLAFDTSMSAPGVAIIEVKNRKPKVVALSHIVTDSSQPHGVRADMIESWATLFIAQHIKKGIDLAIREDFNGKSSSQNYPVFAAWSGCERACEKFGVTFTKWTEIQKNGRKKTSLGPSPSKVKKIVTGSGSAEKWEIADRVREITGYTGEFAKDDESDACGVALAYLIENNLIEGETK